MPRSETPWQDRPDFDSAEDCYQVELICKDLVELDLIVGREIANEGAVLRNQDGYEIAGAGQTDIAELGDRSQQKVTGLRVRAWRL
jgi:hypothetical protein